MSDGQPRKTVLNKPAISETDPI